jgi:dihydrofolate synthase/folylpolyglutamate synthase
LGDSLDKIAFEKAGIFRSGKPAVCGQASPPATLMQRANELGAHWVCRGPDFDARDTGETWQWQGAGHTMEALPALQIPRDSAVTALQVMALLECLPSAECVRSVLASLAVPGRFQRMQLDGIPVILDVAHNPDAATWLASRLRAEPCRGRTFMVFAALADKDIAGVVEPLIGLADAWFVADLPDVPRAASAEVLMERIAAAGPRAISVSKNLRQALARVRSLAGADDRIVVFGSFYTVGKVLALLERC